MFVIILSAEIFWSKDFAHDGIWKISCSEDSKQGPVESWEATREGRASHRTYHNNPGFGSSASHCSWTSSSSHLDRNQVCRLAARGKPSTIVSAGMARRTCENQLWCVWSSICLQFENVTNKHWLNQSKTTNCDSQLHEPHLCMSCMNVAQHTKHTKSAQPNCTKKTQAITLQTHNWAWNVNCQRWMMICKLKHHY